MRAAEDCAAAAKKAADEISESRMGAKKIAEAASANYVGAAAEVRAVVERAERAEGRADQEVDAASRNSELTAELSTRNWEQEREKFYREQAKKQAAKQVFQAISISG